MPELLPDPSKKLTAKSTAKTAEKFENCMVSEAQSPRKVEWSMSWAPQVEALTPLIWLSLLG